MSGTGKTIVRNGLLLTVIAVAGVALLSGVHLLTKERIAEQEKQVILKRLEQVLPMDLYNNDLLSDRMHIVDTAAFLHKDAVSIYRARMNGQDAAIIMTITAPDGYNGNIRLLVAILPDGSLSGVRVISHKETPGLGDPIEAERSDWILDFDGRSLGNPGLQAWAVRKDGGEFDQFTGATITPRAVVNAVKRALEYHNMHREKLYAPADPVKGQP